MSSGSVDADQLFADVSRHRQLEVTFDEVAMSRLSSVILDLSSKNASAGKNTIVTICGGSCTGKSTQVAFSIKNQIGDDVQIVSQDNYMFASSGDASDPIYKWDHPALYGLSESLQMIDHLRHNRACYMPAQSVQRKPSELVKVVPSRILLLEGLYAGLDVLADAADFIIYVEMPLYARIIRRLIRNMYERYRNISPGFILESYLKSPLAAHRDFVVNQKRRANAIVRMIYRFSDTVARFRLTSVAEPRLFRKYVEQYRFNAADDVTFEICRYDTTYDFAILHNDRTYLRFEISAEVFMSMLTLDLQSV